jgi:hypothetical protein
VYPNPTSGEVNIKLAAELTGEVTLIVMDVAGVVLESRKIPVHFKNRLIRIDLSNKSPGLYLVKLVSGPYIQTEKIILKRE